MGLNFQPYEDCDDDHHFTACEDCEEACNECLHCHPICAQGAIVPVVGSTWGAIKSLFE
jgi:MinD superfamily P-loop ATPase